MLETLNDDRIADHHLTFAVRGHLLQMAGHNEAASEAFHAAAQRTASIPEKRYLHRRADETVRPDQARPRSGAN